MNTFTKHGDSERITPPHLNTINFLRVSVSLCLIPIFLLMARADVLGPAAGPDTAIFFDGVNDSGAMENGSALIANMSNFSMDGWVYPRNPNALFGNFDAFFGIRNDGSGDAAYYIMHLSGANRVEARFQNSAGTVFDLSPFILDINKWQHLAMTYDGTRLRLYRNADLVDSIAANGTITRATEKFTFGNFGSATNPTQLDGALDEIRVWRKTLTDTEVAEYANRNMTGSESGIAAVFRFASQTGTDTAKTLVGDTIVQFTNINTTTAWIVSRAPIGDTTVQTETNVRAVFHSDSKSLSSGGLALNCTGISDSATYAVFGHNDTTGITFADAPASIDSGFRRVSRRWVFDVAGAVTTDLVFDLSKMGGDSLIGYTAAQYVLARRTDATGAFTIATKGATAVAGSVVTFTGVSLTDSNQYTIGTIYEGTTWYVNNSVVGSGDSFTQAPGADTGDGSRLAPFARIDSALSRAAAGDTIHIDAGTFLQTTSLTISRDTIFMIGVDSTLTVIDFQDSSAGQNRRVVGSSRRNLTVSDLRITNAYRAIEWTNVDSSTIARVKIDYSGAHGLFFQTASESNVIMNVTSSNNVQDGIAFHPSNNNNNRVLNNTSSDNVRVGIYQTQSKNNLYRGNTATRNGISGFYVESSDTNFYANNVSFNNHSTSHGFYVENSSNNQFIQNSIDSNQVWGFYLTGTSSSCTIVKNAIRGGVANVDSGIFNNTSNAIDARRNFWNTTDSALIRTRISGTVAGLAAVTYSPFRLGFADTSVGGDTVAPNDPDTVTAVGINDSSIRISWSASAASEESEAATNLAGYNVYRSSTSDTTLWQKIATLGNVTEYVDSYLAVDTRFYRITARDNATFVNESFLSDTTAGARPVATPRVSLLFDSGHETSATGFNVNLSVDSGAIGDSVKLIVNGIVTDTKTIASAAETLVLRCTPSIQSGTILARYYRSTDSAIFADTKSFVFDTTGPTGSALTISDTSVKTPFIRWTAATDSTSVSYRLRVITTLDSTVSLAFDTTLLFIQVDTSSPVLPINQYRATLTGTDAVGNATQSIDSKTFSILPDTPRLTAPTSGSCTGTENVTLTVLKEALTDTLLIYKNGTLIDTVASTETTVTRTFALDTTTGIDTTSINFRAVARKNSTEFQSFYSDTFTICFDSRLLTSPESMAVSGSQALLLSPSTFSSESAQLVIRDRHGNKLSGISVTYSIVAKPTGSSGETFTSTTTNAQGVSQLNLKAGDKTGVYIVKAELPGVTPIYISFQTNEFDLPANTWRLISLDRTPADARVDKALSGLSPTNIFHWNPEAEEHSRNSRYEIPTSFTTGMGYYVREASAARFTVAGSTLISDTRDIALKTGWNQVGVPYYYVTRWNAAKIVTSGGTVMSVAEAETQGLIQNKIFWYKDNAYQNGPSTTNTDPILTPANGFWLKTSASVTLRLSPFLYYSETTAPLVSAQAFGDPNNWTTTLTVSGSSGAQTTSVFGVSPTATNSTDFALDVENPPVISGQFSSGLGAGSAFSQELKAPFTAAQQWFFTVTPTSGDNNVNLNFSGLGALPDGFIIVLVDLTTGAQTTVSTSPNYQFPAAVGARSFRIVAGTEAAVRALVAPALAVNQTFVYPNPGPASDGKVRFKYDAAVPATLTLKVFDLSGRKVIDRAIDLNSFPNEYIWDCRNDRGQEIGTGVYLYILEYGSSTETRRMTDKLAIFR